MRYGAGSFYSEFQRYIEHSIYSFYDHAHNEYVQFLFESGVIGTTFLGLSAVAALAISFHQFMIRNDPLILCSALACIMAVIGMIIHISVDFPLRSPCLVCRNKRRGKVEKAL